MNKTEQQKQNKNASGQSVAETKKTSYSAILETLNSIMSNYGQGLPVANLFGVFSRASESYANQPQIQNARIKAISSLPVDYTKEEIGEFLRTPYQNEQPLRQTSEILRWTAYPYFKISKTYQDIPTYHYCATPLYLTSEDAKSEEYKREERLIDKVNKTLRPDIQAHRIAGEAVSQGKVFYSLRVNADKVHNKVNYAFLQQLPTDWCWIVGKNNLSGWTISFNMFYFMQPGTDPLQYGDLFKPYLDDFNSMFEEPKSRKRGEMAVYASVPCKGKDIHFYPCNIKSNATGNPKTFKQNGEWYYYVTLPVDKVYAFEIDDTTPAVASPLSGLMLTYSQQSDYEAAQLSLLLNPLIKIFTGEIPYFQDNGSTVEDGYRLSRGGRLLFETLFQELMLKNNTSGASFFSAPVQNIKSHDFTESANANEISSSFNKYGMAKAGLSGIIPVDEDVKAGQAEISAKLESRYSNCIYKQFERMMDNLYESLNLKHAFRFTMFGSIYTDNELRENLEKRVSNGDTSVYPYLAALDGQSMLDKVAVMNGVEASGFLDMLTPPATSYTQSADGKTVGRPKNKKITEGNEKSADSGNVK